MSDTYAGRNLGCDKLYRVGPFFILEYTDAVYVLDSSALEQVVISSRFWAGFTSYWTNYRVIGDKEAKDLDVRSIILSTINWLTRTAKAIPDKRALPRLMKIGVARMQNNFHSHAEDLDVGLVKKDLELLAHERALLPHGPTWYEFLKAQDMSDRAKLDLAYAYHGLTAPDCELDLLFRKASETMSNPNKASTKFFKGFLDYCNASDFVKALTKYKKDLKYKCVGEYDPTDKVWYIQTLRGKPTLPPDEEMGLVYIYDHFVYDYQIADWFWDAGDVTHIYADMGKYSTVSAYTEQKQEEHLANLEAVLKCLGDNGLRLKEQKCAFMQPTIQYLGHKIDKNGISPLPEKLDAIRDAPRPVNQTQLQAYLGLLGYYRRFIPNLTAEIAPLTELLKAEYASQRTSRKGNRKRKSPVEPDSKFIWGREQERAFQKCL